jgi:hypothetical protein
VFRLSSVLFRQSGNAFNTEFTENTENKELDTCQTGIWVDLK